MKLTKAEKEHLCLLAREVAESAYAPYSKFRVGAAVLGKTAIYLGANVENASYGLSLCAERSAIAAAIARGEKEFRAIAVACIDAKPEAEVRSRMPCGACRQWIVELAPTAEILICGTDRAYSIEELLPVSFRL